MELLLRRPWPRPIATNMTATLLAESHTHVLYAPKFFAPSTFAYIARVLPLPRQMSSW
jgi:hypothetical protein